MKYLFLISLGVLFFVYACNSSDGGNQKPTAISGKQIFEEKCTLCHGANGAQQLNGAADLTQSTIDLEERIYIITNGKGNGMAPYKEILSKEEIKKVAAYTQKLKKK